MTTTRNFSQWRDDLQQLLQRIDALPGRDVTGDRSRIEAEIASVSAEVRNTAGRREIELARLKSRCGIAFHASVELADEPFNPFEDMSHEEMLRQSIETDPEIATLENSRRNAEAQLDLARRGQWDISLLFDAESSLEGRGEADGDSDWSVMTGLEIGKVDTRVTNSLIRQAQSRINQFTQAIASRENEIFVDTLEPFIRLDTLSASRQQLIDNLPRFEADYQTGLQEYLNGKLNIDDLLKRREKLFEQQDEIADLTFLLGANVTELCAATGKFFDLINNDNQDEPPPAGG
jgi:outer membrane protein TolC